MAIGPERWGNTLTAFLFLAPGLIALVAIVVYPTIALIKNSLLDWNLLVGTQTFVGLDNYRSVLTDPLFLASVERTVIYTAGAVSMQLGLGFLLALLFNRSSRGLGALRTLLIAPMLVAPVMVGLTWRFMYEPSIGVINYLLSSLHLPTLRWISSTATALPSIGAADVWQWTPFVFLVMLAGLQSIPEHILEAAKMDGAETWRIVVEIQLPLISRIIIIVALLRVIDSLKLFDLVYVVTRGGPGNSTYLMTFYNYVVGFTQFQIGRASATAVIIMLTISLLTTLLLRAILRKEAL